MKRPLQLSLAIALALGVTDAFALGLGAIQVRSGLNQPLNAEIPVIQGAPGEAEGLIVQLASAEDFDRVGLNRASIGVPIEFSLGKNARGEPVIRITSKDIVREPFLGFLVEANWPKGRLLREYTVLLDPPVMAPAVKGSSAIAVAAQDPERAPTQSLPAAKPAPAAAPAKPAPAKPAAVAAAPTPKAPAVARQASGTEYGPVAAGETLGEVARATRPDESISVNQMMLALLKHNPRAFYRDNVNALKRGAVLRIPSAEEISASGSAREAAASVRAQVEEWRSGAAAAPTLVADTTPIATTSPSKPAAGAAAAAPKGERLALVPPREGKADQQAADRPSGGTASSGDAASKAELARVKEALTSREQESGELKSRVKDLEEIKNKNDKLIALQNSELAELRDKLKAMQEQAAKDAAAPPPVAVAPAPASAPSTATTPAISKDDIWGDGDRAGAGKQAAVPPAAAPPATTAATPAVATPPAATPSSATPSPEASALPPGPGADNVPPTTAVTTPLADTNTAVEPAASATPPPATVEPEPVKKPAPPAAKPAATAKPVVATPLESAKPWYLEPWALGAAGLGGLLLVLAGISGMRKRKVAGTSARPSIAEKFGSAPLAESLGAHRVSDGEEAQLIEQVRQDPGNAGAHLELLSLYYAQRDTGKFEAAAEEMYAYVADPNQAEWREARAMGEELVPHNPLFGGDSDLSDMARGEHAHADTDEAFSFDDPVPGDGEAYRFEEPAEPAPGAFETSVMPAFNYEPPKQTSAAESFDFDLPPIEPVADAPIVTEYDLDDEPPSAAIAADDEFFAGDDAIGTKLDLAKAYLDMGDPDGARAMLEEVMAEGNANQQAEARKLLGEIH